VAGTPAFEPKKYALDIRITQPGLRLSGKARIDLEPVVSGSRVVGLVLPEDFTVERVTDGQGKALFFLRNESDLTVVLPQAPAAGEVPAVIVEYAGNPIEKDFNLTTLVDTEHWFPHAGLVDRAVYDATFRWPRGLDLVASGHRMDGGEESGGTRWERRVLEAPSQGFSFEVGNFDFETAQAGHVKITFAFGNGSNLTGRGVREDLKKAVADSLAYYEEVFGPYPLDELTVSTASRGFSQGLLGFVTISDYHLNDMGIWNQYFGLEDRRLVVAHEIAHQWWGNLIGWTSDRDQWISEAMASYAAHLYAKDRLKNELSGVDLTSDWQEDLTSTVVNGRSIESLGPVVLGGRLDSSLASDAYRLIVYKKGAVVLEMLARLLGEENFPKVLRQIVKAANGKSISTEDLLSMIEVVTSTELDDFSRQFVYGTGLPEVYYTYRFEKSGQGWVVKGQALQAPAYNDRYKVVRTSHGTWDVPNEPVQQIDVQKSALVVPVEIEALDSAKGKGKGKDGANETVRGHILLKGASTDFSIDVEHEPKAFWLDRKAKVFGLFHDASKNPKRALYSQASKALDAGRKDEAEKLFAQALETEEPAPEAEGGATIYWEDIQDARRYLNAYIESSRAFLLMDLDRDDEAEKAIGRARRVVRDDLRLDRMQARLEVRRGRYEKAYQLLRRGDRHEVLDAQDYALLAIAARETGHTKEYEEALKKARENGVDVTALSSAS
jgi:tetratricopeptide (TPR) repeat protein